MEQSEPIQVDDDRVNELPRQADDDRVTGLLGEVSKELGECLGREPEKRFEDGSEAVKLDKEVDALEPEPKPDIPMMLPLQFHLFAEHHPAEQPSYPYRLLVPEEIWSSAADLNYRTYEDPEPDFVLAPCHIRQLPVDARHSDCIIVATAGACRENGSRSTTGVYFGPSKKHTTNHWIQAGPHTPERAELVACHAALTYIYDIVTEARTRRRTNALPFGLQQVIVKTYAAHVVRGMTEGVSEWKQNGYKGVENADMFYHLNAAVCALERERGMTVLFWHVKREDNTEAVALAIEAMEEWTAFESGPLYDSDGLHSDSA